jgi:hypothetical protein
MTLSRREFFSMLLARRAQTTSIQVAVMETFNIGQTRALLVHHADAATRDQFARWLKANPKAAIRVRRNSGTEASATIFRVRMCFGRGLILLANPVEVHEGDLLTLISS